MIEIDKGLSIKIFFALNSMPIHLETLFLTFVICGSMLFCHL